MPNYANSIIYKLCCKDTSIINIYVGSTTNKTKRKQCHKYCCNNENDKKYNLYLYQFIRANGGFENWELIVIENFPCQNKTELETRERYWLEELEGTLNKNVPTRNKQEYYEANRDKILEYREENRDKILEYQKEYSEVNRDKILEYQKKYREANRDTFLEYQKKYREAKKHLNYLDNLNNEIR